jgi:hypothetical protein
MGGACGTHGEKRNVYGILVGKPEERDHYEDLDIGWRIILTWILDMMGWYGLD